MNPSQAEVESFPLGPALEFLQRLWRLNHALERLSSRMEKRIGITAQQRLLLRCIGKYPGLTSGQLAALLHVDPGTVSAAVNRLEGKGILERRSNPRDRRRVLLGLTAEGRALDHPATGTVEGAVQRLLGSTPPAAIASAVAVVETLTQLIDQELHHEES